MPHEFRSGGSGTAMGVSFKSVMRMLGLLPARERTRWARLVSEVRRRAELAATPARGGRLAAATTARGAVPKRPGPLVEQPERRHDRHDGDHRHGRLLAHPS